MTNPTSADTDIHLAVIRKALGDGNAAVMIGSGFSRNAEGGEQLQLWSDIARVLWMELNPHKEATADFLGTQGPQLGEQFVRVFSTPVLEELLKRLVPDDKVRPGRLHTRLLELPWSEIFTTNYDTLIERTADTILDRAHYTIACREDIPQSKILGRRRIVKLHGSFPSQRPFIFTEEDYRRYPQAFAPFVNLVRQSLLENVFCLIGFSGDDPNFLHWIGWIRDMLDQHALPIYLFLPEAPSLGQRALLQARRVTPVVLPCPANVDSADFASRFAALFDELQEPINPPDTEWASIEPLDGQVYGTADLAAGYAALATQFTVLRAFRQRYPGWLVAPRPARLHMENMQRRLAVSLDRSDLYQFLDDRAPLVGLALAEHYGWQQDVLLQCWNDEIARAVIARLHRALAGDRAASLATEAEPLRDLGIVSLGSLTKCFGSLARHLLRWAREGCHYTLFAELEAVIHGSFHDDSALQAELQWERILLSLYEGEVDVARRRLLDWDVGSLEPYMAVRRGALLAEVGEVALGLSFCTDGLTRLRQNQRVRADTTRYLSEEAWACRAIGALQEAAEVSREARADRSSGPEDIDRRLSQLATKGHDVGQQLNEIINDLGREVRWRRESEYTRTAFDPGHYATGQSFGNSREFEQKIKAGFAWLTLVDRVAIPPRIGDTTFEVDTFLQAGWWIRLFDSPRRTLSVVIRAQRVKALEPRDEGKLEHSSGWLGRAYVASLSPTIARDVAERSLAVVERTLSSELDERQVERMADFHLEVVSRLVIRMESSENAESIVLRVIELHTNRRFRQLGEAWRSASHAVSRGFEALDAAAAGRMLARLLDAPLVPNETDPEHLTLRWLRFEEIDLPTGADAASADFQTFLPRLLAAAIGPAAAPLRTMQTKAWERLFWLEGCGLLSAHDKAEVGRALWADAAPVPRIPGYLPLAFLRWPAPSGVDKHAVMRRWTLTKSLPSLCSASSMILHTKDSPHGWAMPADNQLLHGWIAAMRERPWPRADAAEAIGIILTSWDSDWAAIETDAPKSPEVLRQVLARWELMDRVFQLVVHAEASRKPSRSWQAVRKELDTKVAQAQVLAPSFWRHRLHRAIAEQDESVLARLEAEVCAALITTSDPQHAQRAGRFFVELARDDPAESAWVPAQIVSVLASQLASLSEHGLRRAAPLISMVVDCRPQWLTEANQRLVETALTLAAPQVAYGMDGDIDADAVPWLRRVLAGLLRRWKAAFASRWDPALQAWLDELAHDPLPEVRHEAMG